MARWGKRTAISILLFWSGPGGALRGGRKLARPHLDQQQLIQLSSAPAPGAHSGARPCRRARTDRHGRCGIGRNGSCPDMRLDEILLLALLGAIVLILLAAAFLRK
jgi:hypothetical protein